MKKETWIVFIIVALFVGGVIGYMMGSKNVQFSALQADSQLGTGTCGSCSEGSCSGNLPGTNNCPPGHNGEPRWCKATGTCPDGKVKCECTNT